jgi:SnoaL-like domain
MNRHASKKSVPPSVGADVTAIETLLNRNLPEVFGEGDPARRRAAIAELYTEDCVLCVPPGTFVGHAALDKFAGDLRATHPHFVYTPHGAPQVLHSSGRLAWARGRRAKRLSTPAWISSSRATARSRLFMSTSTSRPHKVRTDFLIDMATAEARLRVYPLPG